MCGYRMIKSRILRIILFSVGTAGLLFVVALIIGGGDRNIALTVPATGTPKTPVSAPPENISFLAAQTIANTFERTSLGQNNQPIAITPAIAADSALVTALLTFDPTDLAPLIRVRDLSLSGDTSRTAGRVYLTSLLPILRDAGGVIAASPTKPAELDFDSAIKAQTKALTELLALSVPKPLAEIQRSALTIIGTQRNILLALAQHETDPIQAYLAAETESIIIDQIDSLHADIADYLNSPVLSSS